MRTVFMGTSAFGLPALEALAGRGDTPALVVTRPERPKGRRLVPTPPPVAQWAAARGIPVLDPEEINAPGPVARLAAVRPELIVVAAFGAKLSREILALPSIVIVNLHASILPRHRGASPIARAILEGDERTGVTIFQVVERMDAGPVLVTGELPIRDDDTAGSLHDRLSELGAGMMRDLLPVIESRSFDLVPQEEARATYAGRLKKEDGRLDWSTPAARLLRFVRAMTPWPSAATRLPSGRRLTVVSARPGAAATVGVPAGSILEAAEGGFQVAAADGSVRIEEVIPEGGRRMGYAEFLRGHRLKAGERLGGT